MYQTATSAILAVASTAFLLASAARAGEPKFSPSGKCVAYNAVEPIKKWVVGGEVVGQEIDLRWAVGPEFERWKKYRVNSQYKPKAGSRYVLADFAFSPDDKWIAVGGSYQIELVNVNCGDARWVADGNGEGSPFWINDHEFFYVVGGWGDDDPPREFDTPEKLEFWRATITGEKAVTRLVATVSRRRCSAPVHHFWSPSGDGALVSPSQSESWTYLNLTNGITKEFGLGLSEMPSVSWSRDGKQVLCFSQGWLLDEGRGYLFDVSAGKAKEITESYRQFRKPRQSKSADPQLLLYDMSPLWSVENGVCFEKLGVFADLATWNCVGFKARIRKLKGVPKAALESIRQLPVPGWYLLSFKLDREFFFATDESLTQFRPLNGVSSPLHFDDASFRSCFSSDGKHVFQIQVVGEPPKIMKLEPPLVPIAAKTK